MNTLRAPNTATEFAQYYQLRWQILRKPWQQALGSEQDEHERHAIHRMIVDENDKVPDLQKAAREKKRTHN